MTFTRRQFLITGGALMSAGLPAVAEGLQQARAAAPTQPEIDALFDRSVVIDALSADEAWSMPDPILEAFRVSGLTAIHTSLANSNHTVAQRALTTWKGYFERWPDRLFPLLKGADIAAAKRTKRVAVLLGFQNGTIIESNLANLDTLYAAGTRCIQLTYNTRNLIGVGCTAPDTGLTPFGATVVERMNQLGIIVDLSHCGEKTAGDAIARTARPPAFTHTMCKGIYDHVRAKSDVQIKAVSDKGGMTGIATLGYFIGPTPATTFDDYLKHVVHAVNVGGIDHVGLASDYSIRGIEPLNTRENWYVPRLSGFPPEYRVRWPPWIPELDPPTRFRTIAHGLAKRGYTSAQIEKVIGGNWQRYFTEILG